MHVFVCHAAPDREAAGRLRADLAQLGRQVALDGGEPTGPGWWETALGRLRRGEVFVFLVSPESVRSPGCLAELRYARALLRPVLAVRLRATPLPPDLAEAPVFDLHAGPDRVGRLRAALAALPPAPPLPDPLPPEPPVPYLEVYRDQIEQPDLDAEDQFAILHQLRARLRDAHQRAAAWGLLVRLRARADLNAGVTGELEKILSPGWQPDPERRVDRRYWDGQTWTTLVRHEGREFNERRVPPPEATWSGEHPITPRPPKLPHSTRSTRTTRSTRSPASRRKWLVSGVVTAVVLLVASGVLAYSLLLDREDGPVLTARMFVDAVNVSDVSTLQEVTCGRDRGQARRLFLADGVRFTLERVQESSDPPTFTVLATDTSTGSVRRRVFPLVRESGRWFVCAS